MKRSLLPASLLLLLLLTPACAPGRVRLSPSPTADPPRAIPSPAPTAADTPAPAPPMPPAPGPTSQPTAITTATPTPPPLCPLPPSLMLHSAYGVARTRALADAIQTYSLRTLTYRQVLDELHAGRCPPTDAVLISLDDLGSDWIRPVFRQMIQALLERGLTLTVGVVAGREPQDPAVWAYLRALDAQGVEIASHSLNHYNLPALSDDEVVRQVQGSYRAICAGIGRCPVTLILPFGNGAEDPRVLAAAGDYAFLVAIQGPHVLRGAPPYVVGRIPPDNDDAGRTIRLLLNSFAPQP